MQMAGTQLFEPFLKRRTEIVRKSRIKTNENGGTDIFLGWRYNQPRKTSAPLAVFYLEAARLAGDFFNFLFAQSKKGSALSNKYRLVKYSCTNSSIVNGR